MVEKTEINKNIILVGTEDGHDGTRQIAQPDKKLKDPFIQTPEKEPEQGYRQSELDIIFESDSEDFLKNNILRIIYATICATSYETYFKLFIKINNWFTTVIIDSGATGNFILSRTVEKFVILERRKASPIEFRIINGTPIFQDEEYI